jgi:hypothetical protein
LSSYIGLTGKIFAPALPPALAGGYAKAENNFPFSPKKA